MLEKFFAYLATVTITTIAGLSYWICLLVAFGGIFAFVCGFKRAGKYTTFSIVIYTILQAFAAALR